MTTIDQEPGTPGPGEDAAAMGEEPSAERSRETGGGGGLPHADELVDELVPEEVDWEHLVRTYPWPALAVAAAAGFYLGIARGPVLVSALAGWASSEMSRRVNDLVGEDLI